MFSFNSGLAFDSSVTSAQSYLAEEDFFGAFSDAWAADFVDIGDAGARDFALAVTGGGYSLSDPVIIGAAVGLNSSPVFF